MIIKRMVITFAVFTLPLYCVAQKRADLTSALAVRDLSIETSHASNALQQLAEKYKVVVGIEFRSDSMENSQVSAHLKDGRLSDALNLILQKKNDFSWAEQPDGSIHVLPKKDTVKLADLPITSIDITSASTAQAQGYVENLPQVRKWTLDNACPVRNPVVIVGGHPVNSPKISLHLSQVRLGDVLSALARGTGSYFWEVSTYQSDDRCFSIIHF